MVLGPAALLIAAGWLVLAPLAPGDAGGDAGRAVAAALGAAAVGAWGLALLPARDEPIGLALMAPGALLLAVSLRVAEVGAAAGPVEALLAGAVGILFARALAAGAVAIGVPLFVAGIDLASALTGPALGRPGGEEVDLLTLALPAWGGGDAVAVLTLLDVAFVAAFAAWAWRFDLRPRAASAGMVAGLVVAAAGGVLVDRALPALPFVVAGYLLPAADRLARTARAPAG